MIVMAMRSCLLKLLFVLIDVISPSKQTAGEAGIWQLNKDERSRIIYCQKCVGLEHSTRERACKYLGYFLYSVSRFLSEGGVPS